MKNKADLTATVIIFSILLLNCCPSYSKNKVAQIPMVPRAGKHPSEFVPHNWKIIGQSKGDLNGDKIEDVALVLQGNYEEFKEKNAGISGKNVFDTNPRMLLVLLNNGKGQYSVAERSDTIIPVPDDADMAEPFEKVAIAGGALVLDFSVWYSAGSWMASSCSYKFKYIGKKFVLIGAESNETQRNSGEEVLCSYNFLTGRVKISTGVYQHKHHEIWRDIRPRALRELKNFKHLYKWEVSPGHFL